ncbi:MAG: polysaccharide pyruvyl transferase family protein [Chloroflexi bacterium]|nr:polysaccharide pyruvyl transferase family protein [Chloroflexota bacterium]
MRILFDMGVYDLRNKGNVALLQVAVARVSALWRDASLQVITSAPHLLRLYCPHASPISPNQQFDWSQRVGRVDRILRRLPRSLLRVALEVRDGIWHHIPALGALLTRHKARVPASPTLVIFEQKNVTAEKNRAYVEMVNGMDLLIATGAQYMSDACCDDALRVLDRLEAAYRLNIPTAMVGQGLGPFQDAELRARVQTVLPLVDLIFIRDQIAAPPLLASLGVDPARVFFTGDDAVEMTWRARTQTRGNLIGLNLRVAQYTQVTSASNETIRSVLRAATRQHHTHLLAIPISHSIHELDARAIQKLGAGIKMEPAYVSQFETPLDIINKVGRCRVVVTGAFHPAVFALAQGIPAIGLVKSPMYIGKFAGLIDQFGAGCQVVHLDDADLPAKLADAIETAWNATDHLRAQLLERAEHQIELGHCAYQRIFDLVAARQKARANDG